MRVLPVPPSWVGRALVITDVEEPHRWFTPEELAIADGFRLPRRRSEWMLSRVAAKELARAAGIASDPRRCLIDRPRLIVDGVTTSWFVSLSHSAGFAGAALAREPIGIDVERPRTLSEAAAHLFLTDEEEETLRDCALDDRLVHFWAAKEAIYKRHQGEFQTLKRVPLRLVGDWETGLRFDGAETIRGEVIAALTLPTS